MEFDPGAALAAIETSLNQVYALVVSYAFSVVGAVLLLVAGYMVAGLVERSVSGGLKRIPGFDLTLRHFFAKLARYAMDCCALESCGKCTPCRIGSTRGVEVIDRLVGAPAGSNAKQQQVILLRSLCDTMLAGTVRACR